MAIRFLTRAGSTLKRQEQQRKQQRCRQQQVAVRREFAPQVAERPTGYDGAEHRDAFDQGAGRQVGCDIALDHVTEPAEQVTGLDQGAEQHQAEQQQTTFAGHRVHQFPLGVEAGEGRQADQQGDEAGEGEQHQWMAAQHAPGGQFAADHQSGQPITGRPWRLRVPAARHRRRTGSCRPVCLFARPPGGSGRSVPPRNSRAGGGRPFAPGRTGWRRQS